MIAEVYCINIATAAESSRSMSNNRGVVEMSGWYGGPNKSLRHISQTDRLWGWLAEGVEKSFPWDG